VLTSEFGYSSGSGGQIRLILWQHSVLGRMSLLNLIGPRPGEDFSGSTWRSEGGLGTTVLTSVIQHSLGSAGLSRLTLWKHSGLGRTTANSQGCCCWQWSGLDLARILWVHLVQHRRLGYNCAY